jgi:hypothetical protein
LPFNFVIRAYRQFFNPVLRLQALARALGGLKLSQEGIAVAFKLFPEIIIKLREFMLLLLLEGAITIFCKLLK